MNFYSGPYSANRDSAQKPEKQVTPKPSKPLLTTSRNPEPVLELPPTRPRIGGQEFTKSMHYTKKPKILLTLF